jgi:hypothetical protein
VTELAFVLLFTVAGLAAALLARRAAGEEPLVRRLSLAFCALALGNLAFYLWRIVARDPGGAAQAAGIALGLALLVWGYRALLRRLRRMAARRRP